MTAFDKSTDLPASVNTVEKLAVWVLLLLYKLHKLDSYTETDDVGQVPLITLQQGLSANQDERLIFRVSMVLDANWSTNAAKLWTQTLPHANSTIPAEFKS